jgi:hypothetical protein
VKWYCIHLISERQYQDWVVQQSLLKTVNLVGIPMYSWHHASLIMCS